MKSETRVVLDIIKSCPDGVAADVIVATAIALGLSSFEARRAIHILFEDGRTSLGTKLLIVANDRSSYPSEPPQKPTPGVSEVAIDDLSGRFRDVCEAASAVIAHYDAWASSLGSESRGAVEALRRAIKGV